MTILITGVAGFIGNNFCVDFANKYRNTKIISIDNINDYYSKKIKFKRLKRLKNFKNIKFLKIDLKDKPKLIKIFNKYKFKEVYNFAAQAGVRYSEKNPQAYIDSNITGFLNLIELSKDNNVKKFFFASSSSVYGDSKKFPLSENEKLNPKNFYGMTKKLNEDIAKRFFENYKFKSIGLRYFTVFGEWGRPDMFLIKYLDAAYNKKIFFLNNYGNHIRDFTYINDVTKIIIKLRGRKILGSDIYNICSNNPISLKKVIKLLSKNTPSVKIKKRGFQKADVYKTHGNNKKIKKKTKINKFEDFDFAINKTREWFKSKYKIFK